MGRLIGGVEESSSGRWVFRHHADRRGICGDLSGSGLAEDTGYNSPASARADWIAAGKGNARSLAVSRTDRMGWPRWNSPTVRSRCQKLVLLRRSNRLSWGRYFRTDKEHLVATTLEQCLLNGDVLVSDGQAIHKLPRGTHDVAAPVWIWHNQVRYMSLGVTPALQVHNSAQSGSWHLINERASSKTITHDVFRVTIDHGIKPHNASYAYCVIPAVAAGLEPCIDLPLRVVANQRDLQAVWHEELQMAAVAFYKSATCQVTPNMSITVDRPCLVLVRHLRMRLRSPSRTR